MTSFNTQMPALIPPPLTHWDLREKSPSIEFLSVQSMHTPHTTVRTKIEPTDSTTEKSNNPTKLPQITEQLQDISLIWQISPIKTSKKRKRKIVDMKDFISPDPEFDGISSSDEYFPTSVSIGLNGYENTPELSEPPSKRRKLNKS